jgi:uncharacterized membrane protein
MASQKRTQSASGQGKNGGTATRSSSGSGAAANGRTAGNRTASSGSRAAANPARAAQGAGDRTRGAQNQNGRDQNAGNRNRGAQNQNGRNQNGRPGNGRPQNGRPGQGRSAAPARAGTLTAEAAGTAPETRFGAPPWIRWTTLVLSLAGLGVSIYLTIAHYTTATILVCSNKGFVDCAKVTSSSQSMVFGVLPVAVLGLAFYVFMVAINSPWGWRAQLPAIWWARLGSVIVGIGFVLYLLYAEIIQIGNICLWCTSVHVITFLLFVLIVFAATIRPLTVDSAR